MLVGFPSPERWMQCWGSWRSSVVPNTLEQWASAGEGWQHITWPYSIQMSKLECQSTVYLKSPTHSISINKNSSIGLQDVILIMGFGAQSGPCAVVFAASFDDDLTVQGSSVKERTGTTSRVRRCSSLGKKMKLYLWTRSVCKHFKAFTNVHWYLSTKRYPLYAPDRFK